MSLATYENISDALNHITPDIERDEWVKIGMSVKNELDDDGFELFDTWSKGGATYSANDVKDTWNSIEANGNITVGTLFYLAKQNGWKPNGEAKIETVAEKLEREALKKAKADALSEKKLSKSKIAASKALQLCKTATPAQSDHPYLARKNVKSSSSLSEIPANSAVKILGYTPKSDGIALSGRLLIAPVTVDGEITTVELIDESGKKSAIAGGIKSGGYWAAQALPVNDGTGLTIAIGEGVATILSVAESLPQYVCIAALSASNLPKVAKTIKLRYPAAKLLIIADVGNGQKYAEQAAQQTNALLITPQFTQGQIEQFQKQHQKPPTDFNDLLLLAGAGVVLQKILSTVESPPIIFAPQENNSIDLPKNTTLTTPALYNKDSTLHQTYTKPTPENKNPTPKPTLAKKTPIKTGVFVFVNDDGKPRLMIESKAAKILAELMTIEKYAYNHDAASWHKFTTCCWAPLPSAVEPERVILNALFTGTEPVGFKQSYFNGILNIMLRAGLIPLPPEPVGKIPFSNGLLDMKTGALEPITSLNAATWAIPHNYRTGTNCTAFITWLRSATGNDEELIQLLRAYINACLTGRADLQKFLHLLGPGGTGKSTFIRLLFAILGQSNCITTDLVQLEQNKFETSCIYGKRLTAITDSDKYGGSVNVLKALTGQDPVRNERKHIQNSGTFTYTGMVLIASNEPLASTDYTSGLERRRLVVKFERRIPAEEKAAFIAAGGEDKLHSEIPAIINWALELTPDAVTHIFMHPPGAAIRAGFESLTAQNPVVEWITDSLVPDKHAWTLIGVCNEVKDMNLAVGYVDSGTKLYPNYLKWCKEHGREALALRRFRSTAMDMLRTLGADVDEARRAEGQGIRGVRVRGVSEGLYHWQSANVA